MPMRIGAVAGVVAALLREGKDDLIASSMLTVALAVHIEIKSQNFQFRT